MTDNSASAGDPRKPAAAGDDSADLQAAQDIVAMVETGPRNPDNRVVAYAITLICVAWSVFQLYTAYNPIDSIVGRITHLGFAIALVYLAYPPFSEAETPIWYSLLRRLRVRLPVPGSFFELNFVNNALQCLLVGVGLTLIWALYWSVLSDPNEPLGMREGPVLTVIATVTWVLVALAAVEFLGNVMTPRLAELADTAVPAWVSAVRRVYPGFARLRSVRTYVPFYDFALAVVACGAVMFVVYDYENVINFRQGLPSNTDKILGTLMIVLLLEAARRALGPALTVLATLFLLYCFVGPYMPDLLRHRGIPVDFVINDMYMSTTGVFSTPLAVSYSFVFLFVLFGALLERAGAGKYFIDVAFAGLGHMRGGPAKAAILASGLTGLVSGSSIGNTVTTGTFTIPLMKQVGLPAHKAGAVEVASSTNGQLMPPIMGAAAFIMADIIGIPYQDVVRAAFFPAIISYIALVYVVHLEAMKLDLKPIPKSELPPLLKTVLRGLHYVLPVVLLIWFLVVERKSPIFSVLRSIEGLVVIMLVQKPIIAYLAYTQHKAAGTLAPEARLGGVLASATVSGLLDVWDGLVAGARNMISVGVATATAGIIVGVVSITGLVGRFVQLIDTVSFGNPYIMLLLTAITSLILGMGLPTTANYILMATLTAPVIVQLGGDAGLVFPLLAAHLFVFYFGILADDTPPVGLAAYAAAAIARADPIRTGIQGFTYDMRTAILPFVFILNVDLLMMDPSSTGNQIVWINDGLHLAWIFVVSLAAMFAFAAGMQGWFGRGCNWLERIALLVLCYFMFMPSVAAEPLEISRQMVQAVALAGFVGLYVFQRATARRQATA